MHNKVIPTFPCDPELCQHPLLPSISLCDWASLDETLSRLTHWCQSFMNDELETLLLLGIGRSEIALNNMKQ